MYFRPPRTKVTQIFPVRKRSHLEGLYLKHDLLAVANKLERPLVYTNYITDENGVIAVKEDGGFAEPKALKNWSDWQLFQELEAQAEVIITGREYLERLSKNGEMDVISQFEPGKRFESLGEWRLSGGYRRSPDVAVVTRNPDIRLPRIKGRKVMVFTSYAAAKSADSLRHSGIEVIGCGEAGVEGRIMIGYLEKAGYKTIENVTGTRVFKILLDADALDRIYITRVRRRIPTGDETIRLPELERLEATGFCLTEQYVQKNVQAEDGEAVTQEFLVFERG